MFKGIPTCWLKRTWLSWLLWPLSQIFLFLTYWRKSGLKYLNAALKPTYNKPVIVVGNHWVGGTGKTPIVIELAKYFRDQGYRVGIISRGYQSKKTSNQILFTATPQTLEQVKKNNPFSDEVMLMVHTLKDQSFTPTDNFSEHFPDHLIHFGMGAERSQLYRRLQERPFYCDVIISDDGLQHYKLPRAVELAVFDERGVGNGFVFPAGGLREPIGWLKSRIVLYRGKKPDVPAQHFYEVERNLSRAYPLLDWHKQPNERDYQNLSHWKSQQVNALAAIGNPQDFFDGLSAFDLQLNTHSLADHAQIQPKQFKQTTNEYFITEKDAAKCALWANEHPILAKRIWVVPLETTLPAALYQHLHERVKLHLQSPPSNT